MRSALVPPPLCTYTAPLSSAPSADAYVYHRRELANMTWLSRPTNIRASGTATRQEGNILMDA